MDSESTPPENDPWTLAKNRFLAELDPEEVVIFNNATLENLYYGASNYEREDSRNSKARAVLNKLAPLISAIESYGKAIDTMVNVAPLYLAPIWGCLRVTLVMAKAHAKFYDRMVETFRRIGSLLPRFRDYERIFDGTRHKRLSETLAAAYLEIIILCTQFRKSLRAQKTSTVRRIFKPMSLDSEFDDAIERFCRHKESVEAEARVCDMIEASEQRKAQLILLSAERRRKILDKLSSPNHNQRHKKLLKARHPETGQWITTCDEYQFWLASNGCSVVCCFGIPGCGKSVLTSGVIQKLTEQEIVLFHYCDYADKRTLDPSNLFGSLTRQALEKLDVIPEELATAIEREHHNGEQFADPSKTFEFFETAIKHLPRVTHVVLDGLDEATEESQKTICSQIGHSLESSHLKLFITARDDITAMLHLSASVPQLRTAMQSTSNSTDIERYIRGAIERLILDGSLAVKNKFMEETIITELIKGAKGMFLWVEFQLYDLCEAESHHGIKLVLNNLPQSLSDTYDRLLSKIEGAERQDIIERMFKWVLCTIEPLTVDQMKEAIAFTIDDTDFDSEKIVTNFNRLVRACSNLIVVDHEDTGGIVRLAHHTVHQYLLQPTYEHTRFHFSMDDAHKMAGEICLAYLNFACFDGQVSVYRTHENPELVVLEKAARTGVLMSPENPGSRAYKAFNAFRRQKALMPIDISRHLPRIPPKEPGFESFAFLSYVSRYWLWHTTHLSTNLHQTDARLTKIEQRFQSLAHRDRMLFNIRPWSSGNLRTLFYIKLNCIGILSWAFMTNHPLLMKIGERLDHDFAPHGGPYASLTLVREAWAAFLKTRKASTQFSTDIESILSSFETTSTPAPRNICTYPCEMKWLFFRLIYACRQGHVAVIQLLFSSPRVLAAPSDRDIIDYLVVEAACHGRFGTVKFFLEILGYRKFNPLIRVRIDSRNDLLGAPFYTQALNALEYAIFGGHINIVEILLYTHRGAPLETMPTSSEMILDPRPVLADSLVEHIIPNVWEYCRWLNLASDEGDISFMECLVYLERYQLNFFTDAGAREKIDAAWAQILETGPPEIFTFLFTLDHSPRSSQNLYKKLTEKTRERFDAESGIR
ncbi:hypothetical protein GLAREA_13032 [Glarea lozoyensis ATCC 20868]|uniref:NACHT domain-containing protein n=1 Tax=Glarea lozoyensis (strain ATCC 20868 / MF5171) TaxID=1116229 RepID=S3CZK4_GLAL2|nr:uncharacterized protein GLAREA_13032 [Glarea lozoyensis ATCC 20868]EPE30309.1 hypothetical protein GLAREA_13032 [Glarea lozoyensis ATCC 20868]